MDLVRTRLTGGIGVVAGLLLGAVVAGPRGAAVGTAVGYVLLNESSGGGRAGPLGRRPGSAGRAGAAA